MIISLSLVLFNSFSFQYSIYVRRNFTLSNLIHNKLKSINFIVVNQVNQSILNIQSNISLLNRVISICSSLFIRFFSYLIILQDTNSLTSVFCHRDVDRLFSFIPDAARGLT